MLVYHGSTEIVETPKVRKSRSYLDFGPGFYTTTSYAQAERWARIRMKRGNTDRGFVSAYEFSIEEARSNSLIVEFTKADAEWLRFVVANRRGEALSDGADMHIGPVADDNVYLSVRLFETGVLNVEETVRRLKTEELHDQWTFHTERMLSYLRFVRFFEIRGDGDAEGKL